MAGFATPNYGGNFKKNPQNPPKDGGSITFRILPPLEGHSNAKSGDWAVPHAQHFGYDTADSKDPSKRKYNTFECPEKVKWESGQKVVIVSCKEDEVREERKQDYESRKNDMEKRKVPEEEIRTTLKPLVDWLTRHNREFRWYVNIKDLNGEYYTFKLPADAKKDIDRICKKYREEKKWDPIAATQGLWWTLSRTGKGFNTKWTIEVVTEDVQHDGEVLQRAKKAPLTEADANAAFEKCWDLNDPGIRRLTAEQVKDLVATAGDEEAIEAIFKSGIKRESGEQSPTPTPPPRTEPPKPTPPPVETKKAEPPPKPQPSPAPAPAKDPVAEVDAEEAAALALLERKKKAREAARATAAQPTSTPTSAPATTPSTPAAADPSPAPADDGGPDLTDMDEDAFLSQFRTGGAPK